MGLRPLLHIERIKKGEQNFKILLAFLNNLF